MTKHSGTQNSDVHTATMIAERPRLLVNAAHTLREAISEERHPHPIMVKAAPTLHTFANTTLHRIQNHSWTSGAATVFVLNLDNYWDETEANDFLAVIAALHPTEQGGIHGNALTVWWHLYPSLHPANDDNSCPEERLSQLLALYRITQHIEDNNGANLDPYWYKDSRGPALKDLREFVLRPATGYKREDIVNTITAYDTFNVGRIKAILDNGTSSLRSGVL